MATLGHRSDVGCARSNNEDSYLIREDLGLWAVADGMGGVDGGEIASAIVLDVLAKAIEAGKSLHTAAAAANQAVLDAAAAGQGKKGMGATLVAVQLRDRHYEVAWVGDSRAYLWNGSLGRLSHDHSRVQELIDAGVVSEQEGRRHPHRNVITRVLGGNGKTESRADKVEGQLQSQEILMLCSDGLTSELEDAQISEIFAAATRKGSGNGQKLVEDLVSAALASGGRDNVSVVLVGLPASGS